MTYTEGFDSDGLADELAFAFGVFLSLMALWEVVQSVVANDSPERSQTDQNITLNEDALGASKTARRSLCVAGTVRTSNCPAPESSTWSPSRSRRTEP